MVTEPGPATSSVIPVRSTRAPFLNTVTPVIGASRLAVSGVSVKVPSNLWFPRLDGQ
jgi:hypothetical protein